MRSDQGETVGALQSRGLGFGWAPPHAASGGLKGKREKADRPGQHSPGLLGDPLSQRGLHTASWQPLGNSLVPKFPL